jgi:alpha-tubulin suppressor-like RCC1 family protein
LVPTLLPFNQPIVQISSFYLSTFFLGTNGRAFGTGMNDFGGLCTGDRVSRSVPTYALDDVAQVSSGGFHTVFLKKIQFHLLNQLTNVNGLNSYHLLPFYD